jgi:hypothetical protein
VSIKGETEGSKVKNNTRELKKSLFLERFLRLLINFLSLLVQGLCTVPSVSVIHIRKRPDLLVR